MSAGVPFSLRLESVLPLSDAEEGLQTALRRHHALVATPPPSLAVAPAARPAKGRRERDAGQALIGVTPWFARCAFMSQCLVVTLLFSIVFAIVYGGIQVGNSVGAVVESARPMLQEVQLRSMTMLRDASNATLHVRHMLEATDNATASAAPALARSADNAAAMVQSFSRLAQRPSLRLSME